MAPIQIGRYRPPSISRNNTNGWFDGISTRTPTTSTSSMMGPVEPGSYEHGVQAHAQRREPFDGLLRLRRGSRITRTCCLLDQRNLTVDCAADMPQVARADAQFLELAEDGRDRQ